MARMTDEEINKIIEDYELATGLREPERKEAAAPKHEASKSKKKSKESTKSKAKGIGKVGLVAMASGALGAAIAGAGNLETLRNVDTTSKQEPAVVATVDSDIANEDPTLTDAITLRAQYANNIETLKELQEKVDDENYHFVREDVKSKQGEGVIDFDKSLDNIISYYQTKADALDLMLADNVIDATELKDLYFMMSENEHEIRILAEIENYDQALKAVTDAKNHEEGTNVNRRTVDKIYTGKEDEKFDLFMTFENEAELQEWIDKVAKENSIEDVVLNCEAVEYEDKTEKTKQEVTLYGEEVAQAKKREVTPEVPVTPPVTPPVIPNDPPYIPPTDPDPEPTEEKGETKQPTVPVVTEEENKLKELKIEKEEKEAEEEEYSATEEESGNGEEYGEDSPIATEEEFGDSESTEETFGNEDENDYTSIVYEDDTAEEEEFGD